MLRKNKLLSSVPYLLILLPAALSFLYVYSFGVSVVYGDQWAEVPLFGELASGRLTLSDLFDLHNEHRIFFPRIVMLSLGTVTGLDNMAEMYFTQACFVAVLIILLLAFKRSVRTTLFLFVPISFLVFSLSQWGNMLLGFQTAFVLAQTFGVLAFYFLHVSDRFNGLAFPAALMSGTVASFSALPGLFAWPVGLLQLLIAPTEKPAKRVLVGVWGLVGVVEWVVYFISFERSSRKASLAYVLDHPVAGAEYFATLLGGALFPPQQRVFALISGLLLVGLAVATLLLSYRYKKLGENSFWIALLSYAFVISASITVGRAARGIEGATASRYVTFSVLAIIGVYAMLVKLASEKRSYPTGVLLGVLSAVILVSLPFSYSNGIESGVANEVQKERAAYVLSTYESQPDELLESSLRRKPKDVRKRAPDLERLGYNVFSEP